MNESSPRIYVLYTGGTIGMKGQPLAPMGFEQFSALLRTQPGFDPPWLDLCAPEDRGPRIHYTMDALDQPLDSSAMTPHDWVKIARRILDHYADYEGFVVVHGTDTMAWTASALAFLLEGLSKPVIVTGSQLPLVHPRTDGRRNLITAMHLAATSKIPEVGLFFDMVLHRGCRSAKVSTNTFNGFASPNYPPLATAGIAIDIMHDRLRPTPPANASLTVAEHRQRLAARLATIDSNIKDFSVLSIALFPGIQTSNAIEVLLRHTEPTVRGVVLQAFGEGNAPCTPTFLRSLRHAYEQGVVIVDGTQVIQGEVNVDAYRSAGGLEKSGAISGYDMTPEAAQAKLIYLLALGFNSTRVEALMQQDLRGELRTTPGAARRLSPSIH